eukprot:GEZU01015431.1.p1 GENE.GEZU01015431.1~~GEZU01015431.1.p1  ORF type:complete len:2206 (-),score=584.72 GEZU01015431.1:81-6698(-)
MSNNNLWAKVFACVGDLKNPPLLPPKAQQPKKEPTSWLLTEDTVSRVDNEDLIAMADMIEVFLTNHVAKIDITKHSAIFFASVYLFLHNSSMVRRKIREAVARVTTIDPRLTESFLDALYNCLNWNSALFSDKQVLAAQAFSFICPPVTQAAQDPAVLAKILLCAHHPVLVSAEDISGVWGSYVTRQARVFNASAKSTLLGQVSAVCDYLIGPNGLSLPYLATSQQPQYQAEANIRLAAGHALSSLVRICDAEGASIVIPRVCSMINVNKVLSVPATDVAIANTPEGQLYHNVSLDDLYEDPRNPTTVPSPIASQAKKPAEPKKPTETKKPAEATKKPAETKKPAAPASKDQKKPADKPVQKPAGAKEAAAPKTKEEILQALKDRQLQIESEVRTRVISLSQRVQDLLRALEAIFSLRNAGAVHGQISTVAPIVTKLMASPLVHIQAYNATRALMRCANTHIRPIADLISTTLYRRIGGPLDPSRRPNDNDIALTENCVAKIRLHLGGKTVDGESFAAILPLLELVLKHSTAGRDALSPAAVQIAMTILHSHAGMPDLRSGTTRLAVSELLLHVVTFMPNLAKQAVSALLSLAHHILPIDLTHILDGLLSKPHVRQACLQALKRYAPLNPSLKGANLDPEKYKPEHPLLVPRLFIARHDDVPDNAAMANELYAATNEEIAPEYMNDMLPLVSNQEPYVVQVVTAALAEAAEKYPETSHKLVLALLDMYKQNKPQNPDKLDEKQSAARTGAVQALGALGKVISERDLVDVFNFFINHALKDADETVRQATIKAGLNLISRKAEASKILFPIFEKFFEKTKTPAQGDDVVIGSVVIFMGSFARYLPKDDPKVEDVVKRLVEALNTPSEPVQSNVADVLGPLMDKIADPKKLVDTLLDRLQTSKSYAGRRGAAYGLAGAFAGLGMKAIKDYDLMETLKKIFRGSKVESREGAMMAYEVLFDYLGIKFEPYAVTAMPLILSGFTDNAEAVVLASHDAAATYMKKLSPHGVRMVLPALLKGLQEKNWKKKEGSAQLLGTMAFCAPRQLSLSLPEIIPGLVEALNDTQELVAAAAQHALERVGGVVTNPEIAQHVPLLLKALNDPSKTDKALEALLYTRFIHSVDAPSLSLVIPVVYRGLRERNTLTKAKAAQIVGSMSHLINDVRDMMPYVPKLLPELKSTLLDPIPEVRATAAKALGTLAKSLGEQQIRQLVPWLFETMKSDAGRVERTGAAQGLVELIASLGVSRLEQLLPEILKQTKSTKPTVREGFLSVFIYLPAAIDTKLEPYLPKVLPRVLDGLSDESDNVREVALKAGQIIVERYAISALNLMLPSLEAGLSNDSWRIRQASVNLMGELLARVAQHYATENNVEEPEEEEEEEEEEQPVDNQPTMRRKGKIVDFEGVVKTLGKVHANRILASIYLLLNDVTMSVRNEALAVWKTLVVNSPKMLRRILTELTAVIVETLASNNEERRVVAGRAIADLVTKLGDRVMPELIPILSDGLKAKDVSTRQGVCFGLAELMEAAPRPNLVHYSDILVPAVRTAVCDADQTVREAAAQSFDHLFRAVGSKAISEIVPALLKDVDKNPSPSNPSLLGLQELVAVRGQNILPSLIPSLIAPPFTDANARALKVIAQAGGAHLRNHIPSLLPVLIQSVNTSAPMREAAAGILSAVQTSDLYLMIEPLTKALESNLVPTRLGAASLIEIFCKNTKADYRENIPALLQVTLQLFQDPDNGVVQAAWQAVDAITSNISKEDMPNYISTVREVIKSLTEDERGRMRVNALPGFCLPKGLAPLLPMFLHSLMVGSNEIREQAALGLGEFIELTTVDALKPFVIQITGPLIRIVGERFGEAWQVKAAILHTISLMLEKGGIMLRPFLPQLQTTFVKALNDSAKASRNHAAEALGKLVPLGARVDNLLNELHNSLKVHVQEQQIATAEAILKAIQAVLSAVGSKVNQKVLETLMTETLLSLLEESDETIRRAAASTLAVGAKFADDNLFGNIQTTLLEGAMSDSPATREGKLAALEAILKGCPERLAPVRDQVKQLIIQRLRDERLSVRIAALRAALQFVTGEDLDSDVLQAVALLLRDPQNDVRFAAVNTAKKISKKVHRSTNTTLYHHNVQKLLSVLATPVMACTKDKSVPIKLAAEKAIAALLDLRTGDYLLNQYVDTLDDKTAEQVIESCKRIASKLGDADESDEDEDVDDEGKDD